MLQIKNISKTYKTGDLVQRALHNVSLNLRDNEFVAILGPSGSGKTTLLNIIGGLDRYDEGDLIINDVSTKKYKDRDWDSYRNHTVGFVFQSYNLIPHQTVLSNVEMALTIGGIRGKKRRQMALEALDKVGLKDQAHKKPNQMSGGQMQRVAIARALVNNPKILLADEPTGALDTTTSIQVMNLLKEVAKDHLVVMVTHNPDLANMYANRIVNIKDGEILSDSNPCIENNELIENAKHRNLGKASMSIFTALRLSLNNLLTKKARTILTAFAGSIGIIGIALILSLSTGFQNYIDQIQEETLSSYPLSITSETADTTSLILSMVSSGGESTGSETLTEKPYVSTMFSSMCKNDLKSFRNYLIENNETVDSLSYLTTYSYSINPLIYTKDTSDTIVKLNPSSMISSFYSSSVTSMISSYSTGIFNAMIEDESMYINDYDVLKGRWPSEYNELVIILSDPNEISDLLLYNLGLKEYDELNTLIENAMSGKETDIVSETKTYSYDDLLNITFKLIDASDLYKYDEKYDVYEDMSDDEEFLADVYEKAETLKVVGIVCKNPDSSSSTLQAGVGYLTSLNDHVIEIASQSEIVQKQLKNEDIDVFSGERFDEENKEDEESKMNFEDMISVDEDMLKNAFKMNIDFADVFSTDKISEVALTYGKQAAADIESTSKSLVQGFETMEQSLAKVLVETHLKANITYDQTSGFYCPEYMDENNPMLGCKIPEGHESEYMNVGVNIYIAQPYIKTKGYQLTKMNKDTFLAMIGNTILDKALDEAYKNFKDYGIGKDDFNSFVTPIVLDIFNTSVDNISTLIGTDEVSFEEFETIYSLTDKKADNSFIKDTKTVLGKDVHANANYVNAANIAKNFNYGLAAKAIGSALSEVLKPLSETEEIMTVDTQKFQEAFQFTMDEDELSKLMTTVLSGSEEKTYSSNLVNLGYQDKEDPTSISFYFKDFDSKEEFVDFIEDYNENQNDEEKEIKYTDITGILMSSVKTIVDSVTYVLIAFVSISLIVSSIMIGIITYISVLERTKEIGILRAIGASKRNISSIFNAETFIIGGLSGLIGVGTTILLNVPINNLIHELTGNYDINAVLPKEGAIVLVILSVVLTLIAGLIPSKAASKKDPVIALRSE